MKQTGRPDRILLRCHLLALGFVGLLYEALRKSGPCSVEDQWENKQLLVHRLWSPAVVAITSLVIAIYPHLIATWGPPEFCAGWHFPPLIPWQTQGSMQRCGAPARHPSERPRNARGESRPAGSGVTNTGSPDLQCLGTAMRLSHGICSLSKLSAQVVGGEAYRAGYSL